MLPDTRRFISLTHFISEVNKVDAVRQALEQLDDSERPVFIDCERDDMGYWAVSLVYERVGSV